MYRVQTHFLTNHFYENSSRKVTKNLKIMCKNSKNYLLVKIFYVFFNKSKIIKTLSFLTKKSQYNYFIATLKINFNYFKFSLS